MKPWHREFLELLRHYYAEKKKLNSHYSLRSLARDLNLSPGPTSALIKGTRSWDFSTEWALTVLSRMKLAKEVENRMRVLMGVEDIIPRSRLNESATRDLFSKWYFCDVLTSFDLAPMNRDEIERVAKKIGITSEEASSAIEFLIEKDFLVRDAQGTIHRREEVVQTPDDISSESIVKFHSDQLELAQKALKKIRVQDREFQTLTFAGSSKNMEEMKKEIRLFAEKMAVLMSSTPDNDEVFRFSIQLFPVNFSGDKYV